MSRQSRPGFSVISLLMLLAVVLLFLAMLFPAILQVRRAAARTRSMSNLLQVAIAVHAYHDVHSGMPPAVGKARDASGTVHFHILPYLEQDPLYRRGLQDWTDIAGETIPVFLDPEDRSAPPGNVHGDWLATTNYAANWMVFRDGGTRLIEIADGSSNTIMFTQRYQVCNGEPTAWAYHRLHYRAPMFGFYSRARFQVTPSQKECDPGLPQSVRDDAILVCMADASVRTIRQCSPQTWAHATDPADAMPLSEDFD